MKNTFGGFEGVGLIYANIVNVLVLLGIIYINIYVLMPKMILRDRISFYWIATSILIVLGIFLLALFQGVIYRYYGIKPEISHEENPFAILTIINAFIIFGFIIIGSSTVVLYQQWVNHSKQKNELEKITIESELNQLKNQINPHFLFNMLNNANELVIESPKEASVLLSQLNDLLRYQFNDSTQEYVYLSADIHFLTDYLNLEKVRRDKFNFIISKEGSINSIKIPPLLFIPFVENAVKHNAYNVQCPYVHLSFKALNDRLVFMCENSKSTDWVSNHKVGGLGLGNIKRRLNLLYSDNFSLEIESTELKYKVCLTLQI